MQSQIIHKEEYTVIGRFRQSKDILFVSEITMYDDGKINSEIITHKEGVSGKKPLKGSTRKCCFSQQL